MTEAHRQIIERVRTARRVLVVDEFASDRSRARAPLESEGVDAVGAADGESAAAFAAKLAPELVMLDIQLPDIDGYALAERRPAHDPERRVVLVSSCDRSAYGPKMEQSGVIGFLAGANLPQAGLERLLV